MHAIDRRALIGSHRRGGLDEMIGRFEPPPPADLVAELVERLIADDEAGLLPDTPNPFGLFMIEYRLERGHWPDLAEAKCAVDSTS
jgi:hypothetical protein